MGELIISQFNALGFEIGRRREGQIKTKCLLCADGKARAESDKPCSINLETGMFRCHRCGQTGNIHKWERAEKKVYRKPTPRPEYGINEGIAEWFKQRAISRNTLSELKVSSSTKSVKGKSRKVIEFNYFRDDELINVKTRDAAKRFTMQTGAELIFYNLDSIKNSKEALVVEGEIDALSYVEAKYRTVVSVPNGANKGSQNLQYLDNCHEYFDNKEKIYIATDNDIAGESLKKELIRRFTPEKCYIVDLKDCNDPNEYLVKYGALELYATIPSAKACEVEGVVSAKEISDDINSFFHHGMDSGIAAGIQGFDKLCTFETARLVGITGVPSHGKSEFVDALMVGLSLREGFKWAIFSPENFPLQLHFAKIAEKIIGKRFRASEMSEQEKDMALEFINDHFFFIRPKEDSYALDYILDRARYLVKRYGIRGAVIDPWNKLEHDIHGHSSETNYISAQLDKIIRFNQDYDVLTFLVAHPRIMQKRPDGQSEVPNLYSISGSANFFNKIDIGVTVYRDFLKGLTEIHVQKMKFRHLGEIGMQEFKYNPNNGRYSYFNGVIAFENDDNFLTDGIEAKEVEVLHEPDEPDLPF